MRTAVAEVLCVGVIEAMYYIGYTKDTNTIIKIASYNASGLPVTFAISNGYITMTIANPTSASRSYMGSVFY